MQSLAICDFEVAAIRVTKVLRRVLRRGSKKGFSRRHLEGGNTPFQEYDPLGARPKTWGLSNRWCRVCVFFWADGERNAIKRIIPVGTVIDDLLSRTETLHSIVLSSLSLPNLQKLVAENFLSRRMRFVGEIWQEICGKFLGLGRIL